MEGWAGKDCEDDLNECEAQPDLCNNGICQNTVGSYECYCRPGFSGTHCHHNFDECLSDPCQNGGECVDAVNTYKCQCEPGFTGVNCEVNIDECELQVTETVQINNTSYHEMCRFLNTNCSESYDCVESMTVLSAMTV